MSSIIFENLINAFGVFTCFIPTSSRFLIKYSYLGSLNSLTYKQILSISICSFIKLINAFVFPDPELPIINILYGRYGQLILLLT